MDKTQTALGVVSFWLSVYGWQRGLFHKIINDAVAVSGALSSKAIDSMKKVLYITAKKRGDKRPAVEAAPSVDAEKINIEQPAAPPSKPIIVDQYSMESTNEDLSNDDADIVIRLEMSGSSGVSDYATLGASYHVALMDKLNKMEKTFNILLEREEKMALDLHELVDEVARVKTVQDSAVKLLHSLADELKANAENPEEIKRIVGDIKASTDALAGAVADSAGVVPTTSVILHADDVTKPTVEVVMPNVFPEVVEATVEKEVEHVDPASPEPQYTVVVEEAAPAVVEAVEATPHEVVADPAVNVPTSEGEVATAVVATDPGQVDVVVAADPVEVKDAAVDGVNVFEEVKAAYEAEPEVVAKPEEPAVQ